MTKTKNKNKFSLQNLKASNDICIKSYIDALDAGFSVKNRKECNCIDCESKKDKTDTMDEKNDLNLIGFNETSSKKQLKNIALSGDYGAGKTSILESYINQREELKFISISLAHFEHENDEKTAINILEKKIVNQLFHQINPKKIPKTKFKKIVNESDFKIKYIMYQIVGLILLSLYFIKFKDFKLFINETTSMYPDVEWLKFIVDPWTRILLFVVGLSIISVVLFELIKAQFNKRMIKRIKIKDNEIDVQEEQFNNSYFDRYLTDIIYLFENCEANVIVFEDLDRYKNTSIYERLREINTLINLNEKKQTITFLYLIRDNMFKSKERTKFFDLIIPVIPVLDTSNSYDNIKKILSQSGVELDSQFLSKISLYIDDMRLLKNINNEYLVYSKVLSGVRINKEKLFSLVVYKNIFSDDFIKLQRNEGFVYEVIKHKSLWVKERQSDLREDIQSLNDKLKASNEEHLNDINELECIFFKLPTNQSITVNGHYEGQYESRLDYFTSLKESGFMNDKRYQQAYDNLSKNEEFIRRKKILENKFSDKQTEINNKIVELNTELNQVSQRNLKSFVDKVNLIDVKSLNDAKQDSYETIKNSKYFDLIVFLLRNGYLDENYSNYISNFYEESLSQLEIQFLRNVADEINSEFEYELDNYSELLLRLNNNDFKKEAIFNYGLLTFLLENKDNFNQQLELFVQCMLGFENWNFILGYYELNEENDQLLSNFSTQLVEGDINYINLLIMNGKPKGITEKIIFNILENVTVNNISKQKISSSTSYYINNLSDLKFVSKNPSVFIENAKEIKVKFENINFAINDSALTTNIYQNDLYNINCNNLTLILREFYEETETNEILLENMLTKIMSKEDEPLKSYIKTNLSQFLSFYLDPEYDGILIKDTLDTALFILNHQNVSNAHKTKYIEKLELIIDDISKVNDLSIKEKAINLMEASFENIYTFYCSNDNNWSENLIEFTNKSVAELDFNFDENISFDFIFDTIYNDTICNDFYKKFVKQVLSLELDFEEISFEEIAELSDDKVRILISESFFVMDAKLINVFKSWKPGLLGELLKQYENKFLELFKINDKVLSDDEKLDLLNKENELSWEIEKQLITSVQYAQSIYDVFWSDNVLSFSLKNGWFSDSNTEILKYFGNKYSKVDKEFQNTILESVSKNLESLLSADLDCSQIKDKKLILDILHKESIRLDDREAIFIKWLNLLDSSEVEKFMNVFSCEINLDDLYNGKKPVVKENELNLSIIDYLIDKNIISSKSPEGENLIRLYPKRNN